MPVIQPRPVSGPPSTPASAAEASRRRGSASLWLLCVFGGSSVVTGYLAASLESGLLWDAACFLAWGALVSLIHFLFFRFELCDLRDAETGGAGEAGRDPRIQREPALPWFQSKGQVACLLGGILLVAGVLQGSLRMKGALPPENAALIQLAGILFLGMAFALYFLSRYVAYVQGQQDTRMLSAPLQLVQVGFWVCLVCAGCLFFFLYGGRDFGLWVGRVIGGVTALLMVDAGVRAGMTVFQPRSLAKDLPPLGGGLVLDALLRRGNPLDALIHHTETTFGVKVGQAWVPQFLRQTIEPVVLAAILLAWLSTCFTAVPVQCHGVRVRWGRYLAPALEPGLYMTWPWPAEKIEIVPTERIEQIALGFERDLGGPVLWTEVHYEGDQNLLVGNGEELISISVPIFYRIRDPLAYLETTTDAREALISLAYRQLLAVTEGRDSFRVMTVERQDISEALKRALQEQVDRMHLGLEIVFVGLKDIHPPVPVAPAFQDVVSAEEQKLAYLHEADAYRVQTMAEAAQEANRLRTEADALAGQRTAVAEGDSSRFLALAEADAADTNLFRLRLRLETLEEALAKPQKVVVAGTAGTNGQYYLDLRSQGGLMPP